MKTMLASMVAVVALTACEDLFEDGSLQPDGSKPNLIIRNPTKNQVLIQSNSLHIKLSASDKDKVKELQVRVRDVGGDADWVNFKTFPDEKIMDLDTVVTVNGMRPGDYTLFIDATDYRTNVASSQVNFKVK